MTELPSALSENMQTGFLSKALAHTNYAGPVHSLVHIGAGCLSDLDEALALAPSAIFISTPDPEVADRARAALSPASHVTHAFITPKKTRTEAIPVNRITTPAPFFTRSTAKGVNELAHALDVHSAGSVAALSVNDYLETLKPMPAARRNLLRLGSTGEEHAILGAIGARRLTAMFSDLIVPLSHTALFESSTTRDETLAQLADFGFFPLALIDGPLAGVSECHLMRDPLIADKQAQRKTIKALTKAEKQHLKTIQSLQSKTAKLERELDQITLDKRDLAELRTRFGALLADYETQSEALRQVDARIKAALARLQPPK